MRNVKNIRNIYSFILIFAIFSSTSFILPVNASFSPDAKIYSESVYMVNLDTDICVYKKNETQAVYPASTTKIMTCLLVLENVKNLDEYVEVTYEATNEFWGSDPNKSGPSNAALEPGQTNLTYRDCLYALMLASACEAGNILAYSVAGDIPTFVQLMNQKAKDLGCVNTNFGNPHGLHQKDNFSCAYDMYLITKYAYDNFPLFMEICNTYEYDFPANANNPGGYTKYTTNKLLQNSGENPYYYEYAKGIKTGSLPYFIDLETNEKTEGNSNLVSTAQRDGYEYMLVTLGAPYHDLASPSEVRPYSFDDHITLYKWAFGNFTYQTVLSKNDIVATVDVEQGENADVVQLKPMNDYSTLLPKTLDKSTIQRIVTVFDEKITAPVKKDEYLGEVELRLADETLAVIKLVSAEAVELSQTAYMVDQAKKILDQQWFKACVAVLAVLVVVVIVLYYVNKAKKSKMKSKGKGRNMRR